MTAIATAIVIEIVIEITVSVVSVVRSDLVLAAFHQKKVLRPAVMQEATEVGVAAAVVMTADTHDATEGTVTVTAIVNVTETATTIEDEAVEPAPAPAPAPALQTTVAGGVAANMMTAMITTMTANAVVMMTAAGKSPLLS